ncbi:hypothetical protein F5X99DRAFT_105665 [Biscogniauxia marginata]|nr:hypothetical protein F5X99DRAFT_105665 [Biscogniauxia marginata]
MQFQQELTAWVRAVVLLALTHSCLASGFPWLGDAKSQSAREHTTSNTVSQLLRASSRTPTSYELALDELQQLESQPLCHRIAARLLVNNCQVLEGKDEATVLTDSGRKIRDFVDSYAASLAICDLERGSFVIPEDCNDFRESTLSQLPLQTTSHLHITSKEIDACLSGLGASDSAWNTWVSYRHKALRFCEAARADNDRAQNILVFQRLINIISKLTDDIDLKHDRHMSDLDLRAQRTSDKIDSLSPQLDHIQSALRSAEAMLSGRLAYALKKSTDTVNTSLEHAVNLQRILEVMLEGVIDSYAESASVHDKSLTVMRQQAESEIEVMMTAMTATLASTTALQNQIEVSRHQASELESRQDSLEQGMQKLIDITGNLSTKYDDHANLLQQAQAMTTDILDTLEDAATSATAVSDSLLRQSSVTSWWPYIWCPAVSLVMGSYGLPPSALRNLGFFVLGEAVGHLIAAIQSFSFTSPSSKTRDSYTFPSSQESLSNESRSSGHINTTV